jgi:quercetin dioxygenase-like cupin family protein
MPTDADLPGDPVKLAGLLDYQPHAVVSRAIVDKPAGTLTLFAFDSGEGLSEHTAPYDAVVLVVEGSLEITISGRPSAVGTGEMLVMPAGEPHALRAPERAKMLLTMVRT